MTNIEELKESRRLLRSNGTPAEGRLWNLLKGKKIANLQFRRQYSIDRYILDFYCPALKLAIDLDGDYHFNGVVCERDYVRDKYLLENFGIHTIRFENKIVFEQPQSIINAIMHAVSIPMKLIQCEFYTSKSHIFLSFFLPTPPPVGHPLLRRGGV